MPKFPSSPSSNLWLPKRGAAAGVTPNSFEASRQKGVFATLTNKNGNCCRSKPRVWLCAYVIVRWIHGLFVSSKYILYIKGPDNKLQINLNAIIGLPCTTKDTYDPFRAFFGNAATAFFPAPHCSYLLGSYASFLHVFHPTPGAASSLLFLQVRKWNEDDAKTISHKHCQRGMMA